FFSSRRRHTRFSRDWSSDVCSSDLELLKNYQVNELILLQNGDYALGTIQNGVYITDGRLRIKYHINKTNGLANNSVLSLYQTDRSEERRVGKEWRCRGWLVDAKRRR